MRKFSWFTFKEEDDYGRYIGNIIYGVGGIAPFNKCYEHYKPNRKGGHRHNHVNNALKRMRKFGACGEPIFGGMVERLYFINGVYQTVCRGCFRAIEEDARRHNYNTIKEIEMMEADL